MCSVSFFLKKNWVGLGKRIIFSTKARVFIRYITKELSLSLSLGVTERKEEEQKTLSLENLFLTYILAF